MKPKILVLSIFLVALLHTTTAFAEFHTTIAEAEAAGLTVLELTDSSTTLTEEESRNAFVLQGGSGGGITITGSTTEVGGEIHFVHNGSPAFFGSTVNLGAGEYFVFGNGSTLDGAAGNLKCGTAGGYLALRQTSLSPIRWQVISFADWFQRTGGEDVAIPIAPVPSSLVSTTSFIIDSGGSHTISAANGSRNTFYYIEAPAVELTVDGDATVDMDFGDRLTVTHGQFLSASSGTIIKPGGETIKFPHNATAVGAGGVKSLTVGARLGLVYVEASTWRITEVFGEWFDVDSGKAIPGHFANKTRRTAATSNFLAGTDQTLLLTSTSAITVRLESETCHDGRRVTIKKVGAAANNVTITSENSASVEFAPSYVLSSVHGSVTFEYGSDDGWLLISKNF